MDLSSTNDKALPADFLDGWMLGPCWDKDGKTCGGGQCLDSAWTTCGQRLKTGEGAREDSKTTCNEQTLILI